MDLKNRLVIEATLKMPKGSRQVLLGPWQSVVIVLGPQIHLSNDSLYLFLQVIQHTVKFIRQFKFRVHGEIKFNLWLRARWPRRDLIAAGQNKLQNI